MAAAAFLVLYRHVIRRTSAWALLLALVLLAAAILSSTCSPSASFLEDAAKLLGIGTWLTHFVGTGIALVSARLGDGVGRRRVVPDGPA